jgi:hypothetical protein
MKGEPMDTGQNKLWQLGYQHARSNIEARTKEPVNAQG